MLLKLADRIGKQSSDWSWEERKISGGDFTSKVAMVALPVKGVVASMVGAGSHELPTDFHHEICTEHADQPPCPFPDDTPMTNQNLSAETLATKRGWVKADHFYKL